MRPSGSRRTAARLSEESEEDDVYTTLSCCTKAAAASKDRMDSAINDMCIHQIPGDTHRNLRVQSQYSGQTFKHVLLPVWLLTYNYGSKTYQVAVNGITGKIAGEYPLSWIKIAIVTIIGLIILGIIMAYSE